MLTLLATLPHILADGALDGAIRGAIIGGIAGAIIGGLGYLLKKKTPPKT